MSASEATFVGTAATPGRSSTRTGSPTHGRSPGKRGRARQKPDLVIADRGYGHDKHRGLLGRRGIKALMARRGTTTASAQRLIVRADSAITAHC